MDLTSLILLAVFAGLLCLYLLVPGKLQNAVLTFASLAYVYYAGGLRTILYLTGAVLVTYAGARLLERCGRAAQRRCVLGVVLGGNLLVLVLTRYLAFFPGHFKAFPAALGVSFYTLQLLGYFLDVYMEKIPAEKNFWDYSAFATFFPQIASGPISRYEQLGGELKQTHRLQYRSLTFGLQRILWGLFKKLVISERLAAPVAAVFDDPDTFGGACIPAALFCFAIELYTDFSGYMDIALGAAECLGIRMAENFRTPFFSQNCSEFWRRWHITLGEWFKDYVYYPLLKTKAFVKLGKWSRNRFGKKKGKMLPVHLALVVLWFSVGFWHGGAWKYIIGSGLLHCFYITGGQICEPLFEKMKKLLHVNDKCFSWRLFCRVRTFCMVCLGFLFFRAADVPSALYMLPAACRFDLRALSAEGLLAAGLEGADLKLLAVCIPVLFIADLLQYRRGSVREVLAAQNLVFRWIVYLILLYAVLIFGMYGPGFVTNQFIYQNF
ncbi:MAG: MBOAT family protein [Lachnospiraceae bacterium]|nr:MBOAT family protein [Lachnospiraceae bacterium]